MRAAIYARFSSELQDARSLVDQIALARRYAEVRGLLIAEVYEDAAISGSSTLNRPALQRLLEDARRGRFQTIITESLDRLSRSQADIAGLYETLSFYGVRVETLADGQVSEIHVGLKGTMAALFLKDLAQKTRRGQIGRVREGRIPGGKSYGYDLVRDNDDRGARTINECEATVLRRIFHEYASGKGPLAIVRDLNREGKPSPRGGLWNASALLGSPKRRNGILNNELYRGIIVYNRQRFLKDPATGKRIARENPESEWHRQEVPELRIIDEVLWDAVQTRRAERGGPQLHQQRRPKRPLSGLIYCGSCGTRYIIATHEYLRCSARSNSGTCDCSRTILMSEIEARVLQALRQHLLAPDVVAEAVEVYRLESKRLAETRLKARSRLEADIAETGRKIERLLALVENGHADPITTGPRINQLVAEQRQLAAELAKCDAPNSITLHPRAAERYREKVAHIHSTLQRGDEASLEAVALVRSLVGRIVVRATDTPEPLGLEVEGSLAALLVGSGEVDRSDIVCCVPPQPILPVISATSWFQEVKAVDIEKSCQHCVNKSTSGRWHDLALFMVM
jgi:site-specific DNA recombinase